MTQTATLSDTDQLAHADFAESYLSKYISLADTKAGFSFSLNAGLLAFFLSRSGNITAVRALDPLATLAIAVPIIAGALCLWVVLPRLRRSDEGFIFWGAIRAYRTEQAFREGLQRLTIQQLADARLSHCYALAGVAQSKYQALRLAMIVSALAVLVVGTQTVVAHGAPRTVVTHSNDVAIRTRSREVSSAVKPTPTSPSVRSQDVSAHGTRVQPSS